MPIRGLRKYLNVACQLFDQHESRSELLDLRIESVASSESDFASSDERNYKTLVIVADWKMNGILRLPWRPRLPEWTGQTTYYFDEYGLVYRHAETWDMSVAHAFLKTLWPELAKRLWASTTSTNTIETEKDNAHLDGRGLRSSNAEYPEDDNDDVRIEDKEEECELFLPV